MFGTNNEVEAVPAPGDDGHEPMVGLRGCPLGIADLFPLQTLTVKKDGQHSTERGLPHGPPCLSS
jgi:hypothetical protein